jgi:hypothetical protein
MRKTMARVVGSTVTTITVRACEDTTEARTSCCLCFFILLFPDQVCQAEFSFDSAGHRSAIVSQAHRGALPTQCSYGRSLTDLYHFLLFRYILTFQTRLHMLHLECAIGTCSFCVSSIYRRSAVKVKNIWPSFLTTMLSTKFYLSFHLFLLLVACFDSCTPPRHLSEFLNASSSLSPKRLHGRSLFPRTSLWFPFRSPRCAISFLSFKLVRAPWSTFSIFQVPNWTVSLLQWHF